MREVAPGRLTLQPYVPDLLADWRQTHGDERHARLEGTLVLVDISGFTSLTERLARRGNAGAEEMSDLLDATFAVLLDDARERGGDLVKWGGDAVLLLFRGAGHARRACCAAHDMRAALRRVGRLRTSVGTVLLRMSVGVHTGRFDFYLVGDPRHHRELLVVGPAASTTARLQHVASAGDVLVSSETAAHLPPATHRPGPVPRSRLLVARPRAHAVPPQRGHQTDDEVDLAQFLPRGMREQALAEPGEPEHRSVAVAFVQFRGTDALQRTGGVPAVAEALDDLVRTVQSAAVEHGVTFFETDVDVDGGKIMLVSGAPRSSGRNEERLLRTVRAVMDRSSALRRRVGVNRGDVFSGGFGPPFRRTYSIKGDAVNLAARVMARAEDGEVLETTATLDRALSSFETAPLEPFLVKGKEQPVSAARLGRRRGARTAAGSSTPFVGRGSELAVLRRALDSAVGGAGGQVEVVGEAGIGKSRLVAELLAQAPHVRVLTARSGEYDTSTPYFPFRTLLREALGLPGDADEDETAARLGEVVSSGTPELAAWMPLLGVPLDLPATTTRESSELDEQYRKARLEESVERLLAHLLPGSTAVVVEDAHLLDEASADLVARIASGASGRPWLVVVVRRDQPGGHAPRPGDVLTTVRPAPLPPAEARDLVLATASRSMTDLAAAALAVRSGGNPMFLEELVRALGPFGRVEDLPESVRGLMASQIDRLAPADRLVLRYAAVLGPVADLAVLEQLLALDRKGVRLDRHLPVLADFLEPTGGQAVRFRHGLLREVAYEGLPYRRRQVLHDHVGTVLERSTPEPETVSELLSLHYFHAGRFDPAWTWSCAAGQRALEKYANTQAVEFFERAVEAARRSPGRSPAEVAAVLERLGDVRELAGQESDALEAFRQARRRRAGDPVAVADLLFKQARAYQRMGKVPQSLRLLRRALTVLEDVGGTAAHASRSRAATRYAWGRLRQGRSAEALRWASVAAREAEDSGDRLALAQAWTGLHSAHYYARVPEDVPYARLALLAYEELGDLAGQGHCANNLGVEALDAGRLDESLELFGRAKEVFRRLGDEADQANATYNEADVLLRRGRLDDAQRLLAEALRVARAVEDDELVALVVRETGRALLALGRLAEARERLTEARERLTALGLAQELALVEEAEAESRRLAGAGDGDLPVEQADAAAGRAG